MYGSHNYYLITEHWPRWLLWCSHCVVWPWYRHQTVWRSVLWYLPGVLLRPGNIVWHRRHSQTKHTPMRFSQFCVTFRRYGVNAANRLQVTDDRHHYCSDYCHDFYYTGVCLPGIPLSCKSWSARNNYCRFTCLPRCRVRLCVCKVIQK